MKKIIGLILILLIFADFIFASSLNEVSKNLVNGLISKISAFGFTVAVVAFLWSGFKLVKASSDSSKSAEAKKGLGYSLAAIFVMASIWGIVNLFTTTADKDLGLDYNNKIELHLGGQNTNSTPSYNTLNQLKGYDDSNNNSTPSYDVWNQIKGY